MPMTFGLIQILNLANTVRHWQTIMRLSVQSAGANSPLNASIKMSRHIHYRPSCAPIVGVAIVLVLLLLAGS